MISAASCKKEYFTKVNNNPNSPIPASVTPAVLLSTVEGTLAYTQGGDLSRFASMFTQQTYGEGSQCLAYMSYVFTGQDVDNVWGNLYTSVMLNDVQLMKKADAGGYNQYSGISRILMAYALQLTVDNWGSAPYSQAFMGAANFQPAYDADNVLYATAQSLCDSAIYFLNLAKPGALTPGGEDVIYGGNAAQWIEFAHAIKARLYLHQSKGNSTMAANALTEIAASFQSNADNAIFKGFSNAANGNNPWYQFVTQRGYISFTQSHLDSGMVILNDPRFLMLFDTTDYSAYGLGKDNLSSYYGGLNNPAANVELITYEELQFMTAEATLTTGGSLATAQNAYQAGIQASMNKLGVSSTAATAYITAQGTLTSTNAMSMIAWEEYVALYLNPEIWTFWRRTGLPALMPTKKGAIIPRRLLYPQTEYSYNKANTPANSTLYTPKIFWDK
jgi:hypothetical protein